jgi:hypothetical protein
MYVSDTPWDNGLKTQYPPTVNQYIHPKVHQAVFALPGFFRKELYGEWAPKPLAIIVPTEFLSDPV